VDEPVFKNRGKIMKKKPIAIGDRFGKLTVTGFSHADQKRFWFCVCDCGKEILSHTGALNSGNPKSCGCGQRESAKRICISRTTHGMTGQRLYDIWRTMKARCYNEKSISFPAYGGKGIIVCDEWHEFIPFRDWALSHGYADNLCIDRKNSKKNYCPENCRWITGSDNSKLANSKPFAAFGKTQSMADWAREYKIGATTVLNRLKSGWKIEDALTIKPDHRNKKPA
jgi:hypothetical protein